MAAQSRTNARSGSLIAVVLAFVVVVAYAPILLGGKTWEDIRYHTEVAPPRLAAAESVWRAEAPSWWEGSGLGVPLFAEPSHGAAYPIAWLARSPRVLDLLWVVHIWFCALGVALWSRRMGAGALGSLVAGVFVATTGVLASAALRGSLPALAYLPWIGYAATSLPRAVPRRRAMWSIVIALCIAAIALSGQLAVVAHAIAIALLGGINRRPDGWPARTWRWLAIAIACGLAIGCVQWLPALFVDGAGATAHSLTMWRLVELVVPGRFSGIEQPGFPSLYIGAPLIALAVLGAPKRRFAIFAGALVVFAFVVGRVAWPAVLGAPELHLATFAIIAAVHAGSGLDVALARERRGMIAIAGAFVILIIALGVHPERANQTVVDRWFLDWGLTLLSLALAFVTLWRGSPRSDKPRPVDVRALIVIALLVAPGVGARESIAPTHERLDAPAWARRAPRQGFRGISTPSSFAPMRVYRPPQLFEIVLTHEAALATLAGTSGARWGLAAAQSTDPARPRSHDRVWLAAASGQGGELLARYGIELAILPTSGTEKANVLATRGSWSLLRYPASPPAAIVYEWTWAPDDAGVIARLFPRGAQRGLSPGVIVLRGAGTENQDEPSDPEPCTIERWRPGAIDLVCTTQRDAYAVVSSTAAAGWSAEVDGRATNWQIADVLRRAVPLSAGTHRIAWRYEVRGLVPGLVLAVLGMLGLAALWLRSRYSKPID